MAKAIICVRPLSIVSPPAQPIVVVQTKAAKKCDWQVVSPFVILIQWRRPTCGLIGKSFAIVFLATILSLAANSFLTSKFSRDKCACTWHMYARITHIHTWICWCWRLWNCGIFNIYFWHSQSVYVRVLKWYAFNRERIVKIKAYNTIVEN